MNHLTLADLPRLETMIAGTATPADTLNLLEQVYGAAVRDLPMEALPTLIAEVGETLARLTRADDLRARVLAHLWAGGPRPFEYLTLRLCREVYFCPPEVVLRQPLAVVLAHLACLEVEAALKGEWQLAPSGGKWDNVGAALRGGMQPSPPHNHAIRPPFGVEPRSSPQPLTPPAVTLAPNLSFVPSIVTNAPPPPPDIAPLMGDEWRDSVANGGRIAESRGDAASFLHPPLPPILAATLFEDGAEDYSPAVGHGDNLGTQLSAQLPMANRHSPFCNETTAPVFLAALRGRGVL